MSNSSSFARRRIGTRLAGAFGTLVLLLLGCVAFGVLRLSALNHDVQDVFDHEVKASVLAARLEGGAHAMARSLGQAVLTDSIDDIQVQLKHAEALRAEGVATKKALEASLDHDAGRVALKAVMESEQAYVKAMAKVAETIRGGDMDAARLLLNDKSTRSVTQAYLAALATLGKKLGGDMEATQAETASSYQAGRNLLLGAAALALVVAVTLSLRITRSITRPARDAVVVARRIASGDLTQDVVAQGRDEMAELLAAMQEMQLSLRGVVGSVRSNAESLATASAQIAEGNADLSARTERQAGALQQTAASMEQLGSTVTLNADNARQASQLAQGASGVAVQGGDVVGQVVSTMRGIQEASRRISEIIGVIDGIAFQTNILALNAAVEAARAGDQGRGFAVVAGEVRSLAQRSAEAAREIKTLIGTSVERVEQGTTLVDQAGTTMQDVVAAIRRVSDIVGEISSASTEQSAGVGQVGGAIAQMDQATQQNAALVEESAAAAMSLREQAQRLVQAVAVFKLA